MGILAEPRTAGARGKGRLPQFEAHDPARLRARSGGPRPLAAFELSLL